MQVLHFHDGIDWFRYIVTGFMASLILIGWLIIFSRWMFAICHFPRENRIPLEDFWTRHIIQVMEDIQFPRHSWDRRVSGGGFLENLNLRILRAFNAHVLLRRPLICLQRGAICFSKHCWALSETIFFAERIRSLLIRVVDSDFEHPNGRYCSFTDALQKVRMPGESPEYLFLGSGKAFKQITSFMEKGRRHGTESNNLIRLLNDTPTYQNSAGNSFLDALRTKLSRDTRFNYLTKMSKKLTALSLIQLIFELNNNQAGEAVNNALEAYSEAYDFLDLLDNPVGTHADYNPELVVRATDKQFIIMKRHLQYGMQEENIRQGNNPEDSVDWAKVAANNSLDKVRENIQESGTNLETAQYTYSMGSVQMLLADILRIALTEEVGRELVDNCRGWAEALQEEKIRASVYIAGKLGGVIDQLNAGVDEQLNQVDEGA
ncbi:hypothetical protein SUGI_0025260 [Cryptomeria japonica]|nr:hypothetical protein SUGI_0025260 [Cryptomeria japonica]